MANIPNICGLPTCNSHVRAFSVTGFAIPPCDFDSSLSNYGYCCPAHLFEHARILQDLHRGTVLLDRFINKIFLVDRGSSFDKEVLYGRRAAEGAIDVIWGDYIRGSPPLFKNDISQEARLFSISYSCCIRAVVVSMAALAYLTEGMQDYEC